ncbi:hypothetical protein, partial [Xenorhabdus nematophila]|uniref:hypothetical protein n=1 Tax=Xenorhabdus nematophila TaxID=628 RepID=UPI001E3E235C
MVLLIRLLNQIKQFVKVASPLAKSNGQGFASLSIQTLVGCFCQCPLSPFQWRFRQGRLRPRRW